MQQSRKEQIAELAASILDRWSMFLVEVKIQAGRNKVIWIYVDAEERDVGLDECAEVSQELGFLLEAHEVVDRRYRLNVSTPGLDRPLVDQRQYQKNEGRKARIRYLNKGEQSEVEGRIKQVNDQQIEVENSAGSKQTIDFTDIIETFIVPEIK